MDGAAHDSPRPSLIGQTKPLVAVCKQALLGDDAQHPARLAEPARQLPKYGDVVRQRVREQGNGGSVPALSQLFE